MKLANKLILVLGLTSTVTLGLTGAFWTRREMKLTETAAREDLVTMGHAIRPALIHVWRVHGREPALAMLDYTDERLQSHRKVTLHFSAAPGDSEDTTTARSDGQLLAMVPVHTDVVNGQLVLTMTLDSERQFITSGMRKVVPTVLIISLVLSVVTSAMTRLLIDRPLRRLAAQARRVGHGDLDARVYLDPRSDVGAVAAEMNAMCERLIDERRKTAAEHAARMRTIDQLRHADRLATVGQLGAGLAHELGTPLNVVTGRAKMIITDSAAGQEARDCARAIAGQGERMTRIIRQLLDFARRPMRATDAKVRRSVVPIVRDTLGMLAPMARRRGVELALEEPREPAEALIELDQFEQVLSNLVMNGIQSMERGGKVTVTVTRRYLRPPAGIAEPEGEYLSIEVADQGCGIPESVLPRVFDPFFTTKPIGEGTGLGLSVAHGIVREHGGWIDVVSAAEGSRFAVRLPVVAS